MVGVPQSTSELVARSFDRILLVKPSSLGDVIHALPVLHGLRTRYPSSKIDWLIAAPYAPLVESHPDLDEVVRFDRLRFGSIGRNPRATWEFVRFVRALRRRSYDLVIDLQGLFRTGFLSWASGAGVRIGLGEAREGSGLFYTHRTTGSDRATHAVDRYYRVAQLLGFADVPVELRLDVDESLRAEVSRLLEEMGWSRAQRLVAVVPGARWETKVWPPERFSETIDALQRDDSVCCVLLGSHNDVAVCERIASCCTGRRPLNLTGRTGVQELAAVVAASDLVICQDSAAAHLAVASGRPLVCMMGPTDPTRTGPYRRLADVVRLKLDCAPCFFRRLRQCPHDHRCMRELSADPVVAAARRALAEAAPSTTVAQNAVPPPISFG